MADAPKDTSDVQQSTFEDDQPNGETNTGAIACSTAEASNSTHLSITESNSLGGYTARDSENPFSFRHFLRRPQNTTPNIQSEHRDLDEEFEASRFGGARPKTRGRNPRQRSDCDVKSPCGLPDFVQDHLILDHESESLHSSGYHNHVNDFRNQTSVENPLDLPRSHSPIHAAGAMPIPLDLANLASLSIEEDLHLGTLDFANLNASSGQPDEPVPGAALGHEINNNENVNSLSQLPDFLSDGPMQSGRGINLEHMEPPGNLPTPQNHTEIEESSRLRHQLENSQANERIALARIELLESHLEEYRRRESAETSSLEKAMEQIEKNLKLAVERAVHAESQVVQLKKENRTLQDEIKMLQAVARLHPSEASSGGGGCSQTAHELHTAANRAERSIRDLLAGVEHLRVMASSLDSMDRIEELRPKRDKEK